MVDRDPLPAAPLRLAILGTRGIPARYGGFETFAEELSVRLVERGVSVTVYCEAAPASPSSHRGVALVHVPAVRLGPFSTVVFDLRCLWHARRGFDVVYMLGYGATPFCLIPRLWGTRVWLNVDGVEWARAKWGTFARLYFKVMEALAMRIPSRVVADAQAIRDHLVRRHRAGVPVSVIAYGARTLSAAPDPGVLQEWDVSPGGYHLIVCRLEPENHVLEMIDGFRRSRSGRALVVVGDRGVDSAYVRSLTSTADPRVRFVGAVYDRTRLEALRFHAFAYFHGHSVGGTNPSLLEALGCGNPVIAHDNPFNREVARDAALYFATSAEFSRQLERLEGDPALRERMQRSARTIASSDYSWQGVTASYHDLLSRERAR